MRQRLTIILTFVVIIGLLVIINTISHVKEIQKRDLELNPDRSTYHSGPTGTRALHDFLNESGFRVMRWREPTAQLLSSSGQMVATLVVVGDTRVPLDDDDYEVLTHWVSNGGRLVFVDRTPAGKLMSIEGWSINSVDRAFPSLDTDPGNTAEMTESVTELKPAQPTLLTNNIESVMPSRFASRLVINAVPTPTPTPGHVGYGIGQENSEGRGSEGIVVGSTPTPEEFVTEEDPESETEESEAQPPPTILSSSATEERSDEVPSAPVVHIGDSGGGVLIDYPYGRGRIVVLSDPYLITNGGLRLKDNLTLAINMVGGAKASGLIAFDEYHQGRGITRNAFASYFAGTPVLAIAGQIVLLVLVVLWTNGRRFARPLPLVQVDRRSSLEFVASMAELQERSRAFDLAIENIYSRTRRVLARHAGVDYNSSRSEIAERIAERSTIDRNELETLMRECEETINGEPISSRESINLVRRLREIERALGLRMRSRDVRQAAENI
jgi:hypothetical protein